MWKEGERIAIKVIGLWREKLEARTAAPPEKSRNASVN
jgi:hypothetical protein